MKKELKGRLSRLEGRVSEATFTDDQWRLMALIATDQPIPPELRGVRLPLALVRSLFDDDDDVESLRRGGDGWDDDNNEPEGDK